MATNFTIRTSFVRASSGKSAIASAAYQSAEQLHDNKQNRDFSYCIKEEVIHTEIILSTNAPTKYSDRETLWNAVEASQTKSNSRYARQFIIAIPNEWSRSEVIQRSREFIQKAFVDQGMIADWAYHEKKGNHHLHIMCPVRGINPDGTWMQMEKTEYALDENGNKIPIIDSLTGEQKIRERVRNGRVSTERLWERITVQTNNWNSYQQLREWKKEWAEHCNQYLEENNKIDFRSYEERGIDKVPEIHEGPGARYAAARGEESWRMKENEERRALNRFFEMAHGIVEKAKKELAKLNEKIKELICREERGSTEEARASNRIVGTASGLPTDFKGTDFGIGTIGSREEEIAAFNRRISIYRERLERITERARIASGENRQPAERKSELERHDKIKEKVIRKI